MQEGRNSPNKRRRTSDRLGEATIAVKRRKCAVAPTSQNRVHLTHDALLYFRDHLQEHGLKGVAAQLLSANQSFFNLFLPVLDYERLVLHSQNADTLCRVFHRVCPSGDPPEGLDSCTSSHSKCRLLKTCRYLTIEDPPALEALIKAHKPCFDGAKSDGRLLAQTHHKLFPNVTHLSVKGPLAWKLALDYYSDSSHDQAWRKIRSLIKIINPLHLCIYFQRPVFPGYLVMDPPIDPEAHLDAATPEEVDRWIAENKTARFGISEIVRVLDQSWDLESITCHNVTEEDFPTVYCPSHRVIFRPLYRAIGDLRTLRCIETRVSQMTEAVRQLGDDDYSFEFVGLENIGGGSAKRLYMAENQRLTDPSKDSCAEDELLNKLVLNPTHPNTLIAQVWGRLSLKERAAAQPHVKFSSVAEACPCRCCGQV
ncbi:hypothetical protein BD324DRAFT_251378 [Kockovaella imperatae]|uniref:Uncharacterized protein n=1 Tax=Kockovaella imperatae TaxID=4999 RepID=A0A1Y1UPS3_9TREE|nr:hypothetical protein BD324DRAFT_251378 [Kockovaella imperatae]ORX40031.1 hypothetical protein BD324DRAFT_251378 [Kockovaella imperatae]